jgi:uncharacterized protein (DUF58 family)
MQRLVPPNVAAPAENAGRIPFAFGRRFFFLLFIGLAWIAPAWKEPRFLYALGLWDVLLLLFWAWDLWRMPRPEQLHLRRVWKEPLGLLGESVITLEVYNSAVIDVSVRLTDEAPDTFGPELPEIQLVVPAGDSASGAYSIEPLERGGARFGDVWLRYWALLRLAERRARARVGQDVRVYPNLGESQRMRIYLIRSRQIELEKRLKRQRGHGREFESLREYRAGDESRDISWSVTARQGKLITKLYQVERSQTVWLVLDLGRLLRARVDRLSKLDYAVNAALSLAQVAFYSGDRVALLAYDRKLQQRVGPGRGVRQLRALIEALAQVRAASSEADHLLAANALLSSQHQRSLVVWLTDFAETAATPEVIECTAAIARRHLVVFGVMAQTELRRLVAMRPDTVTEMYRYSAALEIVQRRDLLLRQLRQQGAMVLEAAPAGLSQALANQYLEVKERNLI